QPRFMDICWAAQRCGLYYTAISTHLTAAEAAYIINDCGAKVFITSHALATIAADLPGLIPNVTSRLMIDATLDGYASFEQALEAFPNTRLADETSGTDMLYSSGTTGRPKGILRTPESPHIDESNTALIRFCRLFGIDQDTIYLSPAPLYHAAPLRFSMTVQR